MGILSNLFNKNSTPVITTYAEFWAWFRKNESQFFASVKGGNDIDQQFFSKLSPMLDQLHEGIFFLTGMFNKETVELVLTADGFIKRIPYIEDLVSAAPNIQGWKFTALKPPMDAEGFTIDFAGNIFSNESLSFYANEHSDTPDKIDLLVVHKDYVEADNSNFVKGTDIFLENYLGELNLVTMIDNLTIGAADDCMDLIPINKLKDYLIWREKEFVEKYGELRWLEENDNFSSLKAELEDGKPLVAIVNSALLEWKGKASHPWILAIEIKYNGEDNNGMPDDVAYAEMERFEDQLLIELRPIEGYLNVGRQTADGLRIVYFACTEFRRPVKVMDQLISQEGNKMDIQYDVYKDRYWGSFDYFIP